MGWCFVPKGALVGGDIMLAQEIALETDEPTVLAIANWFSRGFCRRCHASPVVAAIDGVGLPSALTCHA